MFTHLNNTKSPKNDLINNEFSILHYFISKKQYVIYKILKSCIESLNFDSSLFSLFLLCII